VFDICVFHLPENTARVYSLREMIGLDTQEICALLQISEQNCWVILHRARLKLRACLENGWFLKTR
jgi:RNA polymerase sigma-70 factor (ECF subfamily)